MESPYKQWLCLICGFIYDEAKGWPRDGIAAGTRWEDVPEDWVCPDCLVGKSDFDMVELPVTATAEPVPLDTAATTPSIATNMPAGPIVIIGSGYAGYNLAEAIRNHDQQVDIVILTEDDGMHYSKPALSTGLTNQQSADDLINEKPLDRANRLNLRIVTHCQVQAIDKQDQTVKTNLGDQAYSQLILATGAEPIKLSIAGNASGDLLSVNNLADYRAYRHRLAGKHKVLLIGNGLIGCEFANDLAASGYQVDLVGLTAWPMDRQLPQVLGARLQDKLHSIGVNWYLQNTVQSIDYVDENAPHLGYQVTLQNGELLTCDVMVSAIGLKARTHLASAAGLQVGVGIHVDKYLRTSDPNIFALGDCHEYHSQGQGQLMPYIAPIYWGIQALAKTLTGTPTEVNYPLMTVLVKTPICPLTILPPPPNMTGMWEISQQDDQGAIAKFVSATGTMLGFALQGDTVEQRAQLIEQMTPFASHQGSP